MRDGHKAKLDEGNSDFKKLRENVRMKWPPRFLPLPRRPPKKTAVKYIK